MAIEEFQTSHGDDDSASQRETKCERTCRYFKYFLKKFVAFLFSHIGLTCTVVLYAILGGFLFQATEAPNEKELRQLVTHTKNVYLDKLVDFIDESSPQDMTHRSLWTEKVDGMLREFKNDMHAVTQDRNWDGKFGDEGYQWTFADALLFSVTVITTIGYGHIAPKTTAGKLLTILYAIAGIPLTMLCLRNIGNLMAVIFRMVYRATCVNLTYQYIRLKRRRLKQNAFLKLRQRGISLKKWAKKKRSSLSIRSHLEVNVHGDENTHDPRRHHAKLASTKICASYFEGTPVEFEPTYRSRSMSLGPLAMTRHVEGFSHPPGMHADRENLSSIRTQHLTGCRRNRYSKPFNTRRNTLCAIHELEPNETDITETDIIAENYQEATYDFGLPKHQTKPMVTATLHNNGENSPSLIVTRFERPTAMANNASEYSPKLERPSTLMVTNDEHSLFGLGTSPDRLSSSVSTGSILSLGDFEEEDLILRQRLKSTREMVPISVCLLLMTGYMILGAMMFSPWENWDFMTGFYFCFVTLTSIGFGDVVPGTGATDWDSDEKGVLIVLYLLFGMSLLAMSFHLIQEEVKHKFRKIGMKLGLIEDRLTQMLDKLGETGEGDL